MLSPTALFKDVLLKEKSILSATHATLKLLMDNNPSSDLASLTTQIQDIKDSVLVELATTSKEETTRTQVTIPKTVVRGLDSIITSKGK